MHVGRSWKGRVLTAAAVAALAILVSGLPAAATSAAITLSYNTGPPTSVLRVNGTGFGPNQAVRVYFDGQIETTTVANVQGSFFGVPLTVPADSAPGAHTIGAVAPANGRRAHKTFRVRTSWSLPGFDASGTRWNRYENQLSPGNVAGITKLWQATLPGYGSQPVVSGGVVYVDSGPGSGHTKGRLLAFEVGCASGGGTCSPTWQAVLDDSATYDVPAVSGGLVYESDATRVAAYRVRCGTGGSTCSPVWKAAVSAASTPVVRGGLVYVGTDDGLLAFGANCGSGGATCVPIWRGVTNFGVGEPVVSGGQVFVSSPVHSGPEEGTPRLYAFAVGCATGGGTCTPAWHYTASHGLSFDYGSTPAVTDGVVYFAAQTGDGTMAVSAFDTHCGTSNAACAPTWTSAVPFGPPSLAVDRDTVYVASQGLTAFPIGCNTAGATCAPTWQANTNDAEVPPIVANGTVYAGDESVGLRAYATSCNTGGGTCAPVLTKATKDSNSFMVPPLIALSDGVLYVTAGDRLSAYGLP